MEGPRIDDAFGRMLQDCLATGLEPGRVFEVIERDDGLIQVGDPLRYFAASDGWPSLEHWSCAQARGRILDIGAGAGRHALHLQQEGDTVVALDSSPLAIEVCRQRGIEQLVVGTIETLVATQTEPFDTFLLLGNNLGLLRDRHYAPTFLDHLAALSTSETVVIGHGMHPALTQNPLHRAYQDQNRSLGRMPGQVTMRVRYQQLATDWFDYLFLSVEELASLLATSSWRIADVREEGAAYVVMLRHAT